MTIKHLGCHCQIAKGSILSSCKNGQNAFYTPYYIQGQWTTMSFFMVILNSQSFFMIKNCKLRMPCPHRFWKCAKRCDSTSTGCFRIISMVVAFILPMPHLQKISCLFASIYLTMLKMYQMISIKKQFWIIKELENFHLHGLCKLVNMFAGHCTGASELGGQLRIHFSACPFPEKEHFCLPTFYYIPVEMICSITHPLWKSFWRPCST